MMRHFDFYFVFNVQKQDDGNDHTADDGRVIVKATVVDVVPAKPHRKSPISQSIVSAVYCSVAYC